MSALGEEHALDVQEERKPDLGDFGKTWVQHRENQKFCRSCEAGKVTLHLLCEAGSGLRHSLRLDQRTALAGEPKLAKCYPKAYPGAILADLREALVSLNEFI